MPKVDILLEQFALNRPVEYVEIEFEHFREVIANCNLSVWWESAPESDVNDQTSVIRDQKSSRFLF